MCVEAAGLHNTSHFTHRLSDTDADGLRITVIAFCRISNGSVPRLNGGLTGDSVAAAAARWRNPVCCVVCKPFLAGEELGLCCE